MDIREVLNEAIAKDASDVFIVVGKPITMKVSGRFELQGEKVLPPMAEELARGLYDLARRSTSHMEQEQVDDDFSIGVPGIGRFRANVFRQRGTIGVVLRVIDFGLPTPEEMNIPDNVMSVAKRRKGLVFVTGPAGQGKSTTLACIIDRINQQREAHIITMEDPIEYVHQHATAVVTQREIPSDSASYATALRSAVREAPDVLLVGETRDLETMETSLMAAETGQLLLSTLHTTGAANSVDRVIDMFPPNQQAQVRLQLSLVLEAVVSQQLVPTVNGDLVPAFEVMFINPAIRNLIREGKTHQITSAIQAGADAGMITMDESLFTLYKQGTITEEVACRFAMNLETMERRIKQAK